MTAPLRRPIHRGSAVAHGVFVDARAVGEDVARRRVVGLSDSTSEVHRCGDHLIVLFREPLRLRAGEGPGGLLVRQGNLLSSAPLEKATIAALDGPDPSVVLVLGGAPQRYALDASTRQDPASWIDVSDFAPAPGVEPLGHVERSPATRLEPVTVDVRGTLGIGGEAPGAEAARAALFAPDAPEDRPGWWRSLFGGGARRAGGGFSGSLGGGGGEGIDASDHASDVPSGPPPRIVAWLAGVAGGLFGAIAAVLSMVLPAGSPGDDDDDDEVVQEASRRRFGARGRGGRGRALAVHDEPRPSGESALASLTRGLRIWAARFLMWSRLARHVGRRQAEYLSRMVEMFDKDDLDAALRHAIALGGDGTQPAAPALGTPSARTDLAISPGRTAAATAMFGTGALLDDLRRLYRRAFDQLVRRGEIDKAAFVLAELLHENEEAVSFLERHGRLRLAAEIAEARKLPPGLVVRQWFLAKDPARAVALARAHGAFADAVSRLEASGNTIEAHSLRDLWADSLASAGDYAAALDVLDPVFRASPCALRWLDRAIAIGGTVAARMAVRKLRLVPSAFDEVRDLALDLLRQPGEDGLANARAFAREIARASADAPLRALAKPVARVLLRSLDREDARLAAAAVTATGDAALQADVRRMRARQNAPAEPGATASSPSNCRVVAAAVTHVGHTRSQNEDACLAATVRGPKRPGNEVTAEDDTWRDGLVLVIADGLGNMRANPFGAQACSLIAETLAAGVDAIEGDILGHLEQAIAHANSVLYGAAMTEISMRGSGATVIAANLLGPVLILAHVGDCRAYLCRGGELTSLTRDHSLVNAMLDEGKLTPEEAPDSSYKDIVLQALGLKETVTPTRTTLPLRDGDVVLLCTDGLWKTVPESDIEAALSRPDPPAALCASLEERWRERKGEDDMAIAIARFEGSLFAGDADCRGQTRSQAGQLESQAGQTTRQKAQTTSQKAQTTSQKAQTTPPDLGDPATALDIPLSARATPVEIRVAAGDTGALALFDAAELPDGRLLVALGEAGSRVVSRDGQTLTRFAEPAHRIVISDHGDRALVLAPRGGAWRIARLDLTRRRQQPWCDARIGPFAPDFDGSLWYVASGGALHAIDVTVDGWEHLWSVAEDGASIRCIARSPERLAAVFETEATHALWAWSFDLPSHRHRARLPIAPTPSAPRTSQVDIAVASTGAAATLEPSTHAEGFVVSLHDPSGRTALPLAVPLIEHGLAMSDEWLISAWSGPTSTELHLVHAKSHAARARVVLEGRDLRVRARIAGDRLLIVDTRGRLLVVSLRTGRVVRDLRLA